MPLNKGFQNVCVMDTYYKTFLSVCLLQMVESSTAKATEMALKLDAVHR